MRLSAFYAKLRVGNGCEAGSAGDHNVSICRPAGPDAFPGPNSAPVKKKRINPSKSFFSGLGRDFFLLFKAIQAFAGYHTLSAQQRLTSGIDPAQKQRSQAPL